MNLPVATLAEFPHGIACCDCGRNLVGRAYTDRLLATGAESIVTSLVCQACECPTRWWRIARIVPNTVHYLRSKTWAF